MSALTQIRLKCLDCCCGSAQEVKLCEIVTCPLHDFRMGKSPNHKGRVLTDEQREAMRVNLQKAREAKMAQLNG